MTIPKKRNLRIWKERSLFPSYLLSDFSSTFQEHMEFAISMSILEMENS